MHFKAAIRNFHVIQAGIPSQMFWGVVVVRWTGKLHLRLPYASQIGCLTAEWLPWLHVLLCMVVEANCVRQPVSLFIQKYRKEEEKTRELPLCFTQLDSDTNISRATRVTTLWLKQHFVFVVIYMGSHWTPMRCEMDLHSALACSEQNSLSGHSQVNSGRPATAFL